MDPNIPFGIFIGFAIWFLVRYLAGGIYTVDQNQRAVKTNFGRAERIPGATTLNDPISDFGGTYDSRTSTNTYTYTFGPEVHVRTLGLKPFAHALFGGATFSQFGVHSTGFTTFLGGGVDIKVLPFVSARLAQVDWMTTRFNGVTHKDLIRFSAGLVLRF